MLVQGYFATISDTAITSGTTIISTDCSHHGCPAGCLIAAGSYGRVYAGEEAFQATQQ
jgi:hypothetical protein